MPSNSDSDQNPIVALAMRLRARRSIDSTLEQADYSTTEADAHGLGGTLDVGPRTEALGTALQSGIKRLNSILGAKDGIKYIRLSEPLRIRLRFREHRVTIDVDEERQLVIISGLDLAGEYQFAESDTPALLNLSKLSTEEGYREPLTASAILKRLARDAQLPPPPQLGEGPLSF